MRIGLVDLDTSHPQAFAPLLAERGHDVVAIVGGDTVVDDEYTQQYAQEHGIETVAQRPEDIVDQIDIAFLHSVNWDDHVGRLEPFVRAGIPAKVCKPFAGNAADLDQLESWVADGAVIAGGSALRWSAAGAARPDSTSGFAVTYGHPLDYGIHAFSLLSGIMGPGITCARALDEDGAQVQLRWNDRRTAIVHVLPAGGGYGFYASVAGPDGVEFVDATGTDLYGPFLDVTLAHLTGTEQLPVSFAELVEPERAIIAARASAAHDGAWIELRGDDRLAQGAFDGAPFAREYAAKRRTALGLPAR